MTTETTETVVPVADPSAVMDVFVKHIRDEHGMEFEATPTGGKLMAFEALYFEMEPAPQGLKIKLAAPHANVFIFLKEEIVGHVAEIDATAAANIRWTNEQSVVGALPGNFKVLKVIKRSTVFDGLLRVTVGHDNVAEFTGTGFHVRLMLPLIRGRTPIWPRMAENGTPVWPQGDDKLHARFISIKNVRVDTGELDIDIVHHDGGLISDWAHHAQAGDTIGVMGPAGGTTIEPTKGLFFAADGTGISTVARLMERVGPDVSGDVVAALPATYDPADYFPQSKLRIHTLAPDRFENEIVERTKELTGRGKTTYAYFAGEFQNAQDLRAHFKGELGLGKTTQISTAYWRRGVPGFGS